MGLLPKILAIYLPQFHETMDNNKWWGKGFTDWDTVRSSQSYFDGQIAPRIPYSGNYYDLSDIHTLEQQVLLAKKYGIDGFCLYHYYFAAGKRELETPEQLILQHKDLDIHYCLNWASEPWIRSWSRISGNVWAERYDDKGSEDMSGVLVNQDYGDEEQWRSHFKELLPHFKDKRYIKIGGKPVFIFYDAVRIRCLKQMVKCWRNLAIESGLEGLYLIGAKLKTYNDVLDAALIYEPRNAFNKLNSKNKIIMQNGVRCYDYDSFWNEVLDENAQFGMTTLYSGTVDYDDTPRRGDKGECLINVSSNRFCEGLKELIEKSIAEGNELVFINAWNEWGEGMYLEPDEHRKYSMLEAVENAKKLVDVKYVEKDRNDKQDKDRNEICELSYRANKFKELFEVADAWLSVMQDGTFSLKKYLEKRGFSNVAIYGMSSLGKHLLVQARKENIEPLYGVDRYVGQFGIDFKIYRPEEELPDVDCIIVTAYDYESIKEYLQEKGIGNIVYLGDIVRCIGE